MPITSHSTALAAMAISTTDPPERIGAPNVGNSGAASTAATKPPTPRAVDVLLRSISTATTPSTAGISSASIGPRERMLRRYDRPLIGGTGRGDDCRGAGRGDGGGICSNRSSPASAPSPCDAAGMFPGWCTTSMVRGQRSQNVAGHVMAASTACRWWSMSDRDAGGGHVSDASMCALASCAVIGAWIGGQWPIVAIIGAIGVVGRRAMGRRVGPVVVIGVFVAVLAGALSQHAWSSAQPREVGPYQGWATVMSDPTAVGRGVRVVLEIEGERFDATVYGSARRRLVVRQAGERIEVVGERRLAEGPWARRAQVRHVVGDLVVERVGAWAPGTSISIASNRLRGALRSAALEVMPADQAALFTGLVVGDDTQQPVAMIEQFRASGLSHLTAVSGQNVAFVLAVVGVGLRSLPRWWRFGATLAVIGWFVVLTRVEPSVVRAGAMAALSALAFALGHERTATRTLALAVIGLVLVDPLLVWSVGFWLSVGATFGVSAIAPELEHRLRGPHWLVAPLSITLGAQVGVFLPTWLVFHRMPLFGVVANLLAVPVAGFVMLYGIPAGLVAAAVPALAEVVMWPATAGTRWVSTVAGLAARAEPHGRVAAAGWVVQLAALMAVWRGRRRVAPTGGRSR